MQYQLSSESNICIAMLNKYKVKKKMIQYVNIQLSRNEDYCPGIVLVA